ncbi:MAG TPA: hypothetical protein VFO69_12615 [Allosphingosinicella sp.]|nr:hypothetical protein [Allosphingosinicella sp.]
MRSFTAFLLFMLPAAALAVAPLRTLEPGNIPPAQRTETGMPNADDPEPGTTNEAAGSGVGTSIDGQIYHSLDDYLARLERDGWVGKEWYQEVSPGVYERVTNLRPPPAKRLYTRAELASMFGFPQ